jgi:phosphoenolpyruvate phosphomutase
MLPVAGRPLLRRLVDAYKEQGIHDITVVAGYRPEAIDVPGIKLVINPDHATGGELVSIDAARAGLTDDFVLSYGDLLFRRYVLRDLLDCAGDLVVVVDSEPYTGGNYRDPAYCSAPDDRALFDAEVRLTGVGPGCTGTLGGRWIGMLRARGDGARRVREALAKLRQRPDFDRLGAPDLLNRLVADGAPIRVHYIHGHWLDVNDLDDLRQANEFAHGNGVPA